MAEPEPDHVQVVSSLSQFNEIINSNEYSVFDFWATWCGPCKVIYPVFAKLAQEHRDAESADVAPTRRVGFYKVDVHTVKDVVKEVGIQSIPTFIVFKSGRRVETMKGTNAGKLTDLVTKAVGNKFRPGSA